MLNRVSFGGTTVDGECDTRVEITVSSASDYLIDESAIQYGLVISYHKGALLHSFVSVPNVSSKFSVVKELAEIIEKGNVAPITAADIIEDYIAYHS